MVLADGCFDPCHLGHVHYLQAAAQLGNPLFVNIAPDAAIRAKGREPFQTRTERGLTIEAFGCVANVCYFSLPEAIRYWKPEIVAKGKDWKDRLPYEVLEACYDVGARIVFTDTQTRTSTERLHGR